jgi:hypothetical protein
VRNRKVAYTLNSFNGRRGDQVMPASKARGARSARNVEKQKKKARRVIARKKTTRSAGNTMGARRSAKKAAGKKRATKARRKA